MVSVGICGINYKTANLKTREAIARGAESLRGEKSVFFSHPVVLLSTCNRTEIYFSANDLALTHSDLLAYLRTAIEEPFEHRLYSYFGMDCFAHLCRVSAGLDSAILAETQIQRQVKDAYFEARNLSSDLHFVFQKALNVAKEVRTQFNLQRMSPSLYVTLWQLAQWKQQRILLVGYSEINRGLLSFLMNKGVKNLSLCTQAEGLQIEGVKIFNRSFLNRWREYDVIVCATKASQYLIEGGSDQKQIIFDLSVPRNVDPNTKATLYNIEEIHRFIEQKQSLQNIERVDTHIWQNVLRLSALYRFKTQRVLQSVGME